MNENGTVLPSAISAHLTAEQLEVYILHYRIREITLQLQLPDAALEASRLQNKVLRPRRSRSPDPEYDPSGRRTNTPVQRLRTALATERHRCIEDIMGKLPSYRPPVDYRRPTRFTDRLFIPQTDHPSINFIGQILGPRGSSLKNLQERAGGANIVLRGKGSVKEGRMQRYQGRQRIDTSGADQSALPLHVVITANTQQQVHEAKKLVQQVIDDAVAEPDWMNERKKNQLRDLAIANGTFRDDEGRQARQDLQPLKHADCSSDPVRSQGLVDDSGFEEDYAQLLADIAGTQQPCEDGTNPQQQQQRPKPRSRLFLRGGGLGIAGSESFRLRDTC